MNGYDMNHVPKPNNSISFQCLWLWPNLNLGLLMEKIDIENIIEENGKKVWISTLLFWDFGPNEVAQ